MRSLSRCFGREIVWPWARTQKNHRNRSYPFLTAPLATRLIQLAFNVENELPDGDEILPKLLAKHGQFDVLIGNPPIKSKDNDRNNTWVDKNVDPITGDNSPLKEDGVVAISLPVKHEVVERLKKIHLTTMTTGMERHFPGTPARHNYHLRNNQPSEEGELEILTHEGVSKTISITEMKYFGKTADVELSMLQQSYTVQSTLLTAEYWRLSLGERQD